MVSRQTRPPHQDRNYGLDTHLGLGIPSPPSLPDTHFPYIYLHYFKDQAVGRRFIVESLTEGPGLRVWVVVMGFKVSGAFTNYGPWLIIQGANQLLEPATPPPGPMSFAGVLLEV